MTKLLLNREYHGYEASVDVGRDVEECIEDLPDTWYGILKVVIMYEEEKENKNE